MKVIVFVFLQFVCGNGSKDLLRFAINKMKKVDYNRSEEVLKDSCIIDLVEEAVYDLGNTYMFIADDHMHEELLYNLQTNFLNSYFTDPTSFTWMNVESFKHLLIFRKEFRLEDVIRMNSPPQATKFFFLVRNYRELLENFQTLWKHRLVHAVAAFVDDKEAYFYTYFPYTRSHCGRVGTPHLVAKCNVFTGIFSHKEKLYPNKVNDLYKCRINVTFRENPPASFYSQAKKLTGWEVDFMSELLQQMNGVPNYRILNTKKKFYSRRTGYKRLIENSEIGGGLAVSVNGLLKTDFCLYGMPLCTVWAVTRKEPTLFSADFLVEVFPIRVWILLTITYFVMALTIRLFFKIDFANILFKLLPFLMGTTTKVKRTSRTLGALWLWFCLIVNAIYQSGYRSRLLVPRTPQKSSNTEEIMNSSLKIIGAPDILTDLIPLFKLKYHIKEKRFKNGNGLTYTQWIHKMTAKKDYAYLGFKEIIRYHVDKTELANKVFIPETCEITYLLSLVLKKNSHLTEKLSQISSRLNENGILEFHIRKQFSKVSARDIPQKLAAILRPKNGYKSDTLPPPVNKEKFWLVFLYLLTGNIIALLIFLVETICKGKNKNDNEKIDPEIKAND